MTTHRLSKNYAETSARERRRPPFAYRQDRFGNLEEVSKTDEAWQDNFFDTLHTVCGL